MEIVHLFLKTDNSELKMALQEAGVEVDEISEEEVKGLPWGEVRWGLIVQDRQMHWRAFGGFPSVDIHGDLTTDMEIILKEVKRMPPPPWSVVYDSPWHSL